MAPPATVIDEDDAYHSASDSDFEAHDSPSSGEESASSGDEGQKKESRVKKRKNDDLEIGSGDEGIIAQGRKKRRKKAKGKKGKDGSIVEDAEDNEDDGTGIRVRLRSGRGGEDKASKARPTHSAATVDVDAIWARLNAPPSTTPAPPPPPRPPSLGKENISPSELTSPPSPTTETPPPPEETITIPSTYVFAGETHTTQKTVPISSPEAQAYLSHKQIAQSRPPRPLARKNLLEPNPSRLIKGVALPPRMDLPPTIGGTMEKGKGVEKRKDKGKEVKLNTVEKSKLDWEAEVEREGIRDELQKAGKSGKDYLGRMDFLGRVDEGREERERAARLAGKA